MYLLKEQIGFRMILQTPKILLYFVVLIALIGMWILPNVLPGLACVNEGYVLYWLLASLVVAIASLEKEIVLEIPYLKIVLEYLGERSYGIYLSNLVCLRFISETMSRAHLSINSPYFSFELFISMILILIISDLTFRWIEKPPIQIGARMAENIMSSRLQINTPKKAFLENSNYSNNSETDKN